MTFLKNLTTLQYNSHTSRTIFKGSGIRTHNNGFEDHNFTVKLFPLLYLKKDLATVKPHLNKSIDLFKSVVGSYNLYLTIFCVKKDETKTKKNHHK